MNEKEFNKKLIKGFNAISLRSFEACHLPLVPDLYAISAAWGEFWIESKVVDSDRQQLPFRPGQAKWAEELMRDGGKYIVLVVREPFVHVLAASKMTIQNLAIENLLSAQAGWGFGTVEMKRGSDWLPALEQKILNALRVRFLSPQERPGKPLRVQSRQTSHKRV